MNDQDLLKELEQLEVIESNELAVGNAFHAFRFTAPGVTNEEPAQDQPVGE